MDANAEYEALAQRFADTIETEGSKLERRGFSKADVVTIVSRAWEKALLTSEYDDTKVRR